jgi:hypothetical protein
MNALIFQAVVALLGQRSVAPGMQQRYADAIVEAVQLEPRLPFSGRLARERTALLAWALAYHEAAVDLEAVERCTFRTDHGWQDWGRSVGVGQVHEGPARYGHTREEICGDLVLQFRLIVRYLAEQVARCGDVERALTSYNQNTCAASTYASGVLRAYRAASFWDPDFPRVPR